MAIAAYWARTGGSDLAHGASSRSTTSRIASARSFQTRLAQHASYAQVFWAPREWLVASVIGERLSVHQPFEERLNAGALEVTTRLTSVATIGATARVQRDVIAHQWSKSILLQVALKTVY